MNALCRIGLHRKVRVGVYEIPAEPGTVTVTGDLFELVAAWSYLHDHRCRRCPTKWINGRRV